MSWDRAKNPNAVRNGLLVAAAVAIGYVAAILILYNSVN